MTAEGARIAEELLDLLERRTKLDLRISTLRDKLREEEAKDRDEAPGSD